MTNMINYLERPQGDTGTAGSELVSTRVEVCSISSEIDGVRERSNGADVDWRDFINRSKAVV